MQDLNKESTFLGHGPCPDCESSDALAEYDDGHTHCYSCGTTTQPDGEIPAAVPPKESQKQKDLLEGSYQAIKARGLTEESCKKFGYQVGFDAQGPIQIANYRKDGAVVAQKIRGKDKRFRITGDAKALPLFGSHLWSTGKKLVICEGEIDTITVSQIQNHKWATVGLPNGCASAVRSVKENWEYLEGFDEIILMFDMDEPGQKAALAVAGAPCWQGQDRPPAGQRRKRGVYWLVNRPVVNAIFQAREYRPDGIVAATDLRSQVSVADAASAITYPYDKLNEITKGLRLGELVTVTAGSGIGKSTFIRELSYHLHRLGESVGMMMLEESTKRTLLGLVGIHLSKNLTVDRGETTDEEIEQAFDDLSSRPSDVPVRSLRLDLTRHNTQSHHLHGQSPRCEVGHSRSHIDPGVEPATNDERKLIDMVMTKLATLTQKLQIGLIVISHLRRPEGDKGHEDGAKVRLGQLRGSHAVAQLSSMCISLQIDPDNPDGDTRHLHVLKNRFTGETGFAGSVGFNRNTGRLTSSQDMF